MNLMMTLGEAFDARLLVMAQCQKAHRYEIDVESLLAMRGRLVRLDEALLTLSWCPTCGELGHTFDTSLREER